MRLRQYAYANLEMGHHDGQGRRHECTRGNTNRRVTVHLALLITLGEKQPHCRDEGDAIANKEVRPPVVEKAFGIGSEEENHVDIDGHGEGPPWI